MSKFDDSLIGEHFVASVENKGKIHITFSDFSQICMNSKFSKIKAIENIKMENSTLIEFDGKYSWVSEVTANKLIESPDPVEYFNIKIAKNGK